MKEYAKIVGWAGLLIAAVYVTGCGVVAYVATMKEWGLM